ncbi:glutathione S-transferase [Profundibacter sp.]
MTRPLLYSFRRCPYAMRARLALASANITCELREILLRDKAPELIKASPKATVPVLLTPDVIDESLDIMLWALCRNDPEGWLQMPTDGRALIAKSDTHFKPALDAYKYQRDEDARATAAAFLHSLDQMLAGQPYLYGQTATLADMAILTFVRQFAFVDKPWFDTQPWPNLSRWLENFIASQRFTAIMQKYPKWQAGDPVILFPPTP